MLDLIDEAEQDDVQAVLDEHDNKVADATTRIQQLLTKTPKPKPLLSESNLELRRQLYEQLDRIESKLHAVHAAMRPKPDNCLLRHYEEQIAGFKSELTDISCFVTSMKDGDKNLSGREIASERTIFNVCLKIKRMLEANKPGPLPSSTTANKRD